MPPFLPYLLLLQLLFWTFFWEQVELQNLMALDEEVLDVEALASYPASLVQVLWEELLVSLQLPHFQPQVIYG